MKIDSLRSVFSVVDERITDHRFHIVEKTLTCTLCGHRTLVCDGGNVHKERRDGQLKGARVTQCVFVAAEVCIFLLCKAIEILACAAARR